jgi:hypothetical protein
MNRSLQLISFLLFLIPFTLLAQKSNKAALSFQILSNRNLDTVQKNALKLLTGFSAGTSYNEVWIRDFNTFIKGSLKVHNKEIVKEMLLLFFQSQEKDGNVVDGLVDTSKAHGDYAYRHAPLLP